MATTEEIAREVLALPEGRYFHYDDALDLELTERLNDREWEGLAIAAPPRIDLGEHSEVPVLLVSVESGLHRWEVDPEQNRILLAMGLNDGLLRASTAYPLPHEKRRGPREVEPRPNEMMAEARVTSTDGFDARKLLRLPDLSASYAITLIAFDWRSNTVAVELTGTASDRPVAPTARAISPAANTGLLPSYVPNAQSPSLPSLGIAGAFVPGPPAGGALVLSGSFRLELAPPVARVSRAAWTGDDASFHAAFGDPTAQVTVPIAIAVVGKDYTQPLMASIVAPAAIDGGASADDAQAVTGHFTVDLATLLAEPLAAGEYRSYLFAGRHASEPIRFVVP